MGNAIITQKKTLPPFPQVVIVPFLAIKSPASMQLPLYARAVSFHFLSLIKVGCSNIYKLLRSIPLRKGLRLRAT